MWNYKDIIQKYDSKLTSINSSQLPKTVKFVEKLLQPGQQWLDVGGGRFDNSVEYFKNLKAELLVYDPFNRSQEHNAKVVKQIIEKKCDGVMCNNVLNVIAEKENRKQVIQQAFEAVKEDGFAFFLTYEGNKTGEAKITKQTKESNCFQMNQKTEFYLDEIKEVFGKNVYRKGSFIIAQKSLQLNNKLEDLKDITKSLALKRHQGIGKFIGGNIYVHKNYVEIFPQEQYKNALKILKENVKDFDYVMVKYNKDKGSFSFIKSPDFDTSHEPIAGDAILVNSDGSLKFTAQKKDPQIYHHKWLFVKDDYQGFNVEESLSRTILWKNKMGVNKDLSSRIGTQSVWNDWLKEVGLTSIKKMKQ
jgi:ubiquinone/menaquinone biosynthesis C-methylase UbiE